jgi:hypothetical protein
MLEFSAQLCELLPLYPSLWFKYTEQTDKLQPQSPLYRPIFWMTTYCIVFYESYLSTLHPVRFPKYILTHVSKCSLQVPYLVLLAALLKHMKLKARVFASQLWPTLLTYVATCSIIFLLCLHLAGGDNFVGKDGLKSVKMK